MFAVIPNLSRENAEEVTRKVCAELVKLKADFAMVSENKKVFSDICDLFFDEDELDYDDWDWDSLSDEQKAEVEEIYREEIENSINYCAEEISEREYLIAIGELDEDE